MDPGNLILPSRDHAKSFFSAFTLIEKDQVDSPENLFLIFLEKSVILCLPRVPILKESCYCPGRLTPTVIKNTQMFFLRSLKTLDCPLWLPFPVRPQNIAGIITKEVG